MINEISKKTFVLSIVKFVLTMVSLLELLFMPLWGETVLGAWYYIYVCLSGIFKKPTGLSFVYHLFGSVFFILFLVFEIIMVVRNIKLFIAMLNIKKGKREYSTEEIRHDCKLAHMILPAIFYAIGMFVMTGLGSAQPYLAIVFMIADIVIFSIYKKSLGFGGGKAVKKAQTPEAEAAPAQSEQPAEPVAPAEPAQPEQAQAPEAEAVEAEAAPAATEDKE